jgi:Sortase domain
VASDRSADSRTRRRRTALAGLALSGALAAGAIGVWFTWRTPDAVRLTGSSPSSDMAARAAGAADPTVPPTSPPQTASPTVAPSVTANAQGVTSPVQITPVAPPVRIAIPSKQIAAQVIPEGLDREGSLVIPPPAQVGWYDGGPMPGQAGSTLIAGHIDDHGVPGAFLHLNAVPLGAQVALTTADGRTLNYTVTDRFSIPQTKLAASRQLTRTGPSQLVLKPA